jgi:hypothetical protein
MARISSSVCLSRVGSGARPSPYCSDQNVLSSCFQCAGAIAALSGIFPSSRSHAGEPRTRRCDLSFRQRDEARPASLAGRHQVLHFGLRRVHDHARHVGDRLRALDLHRLLRVRQRFQRREEVIAQVLDLVLHWFGLSG